MKSWSFPFLFFVYCIIFIAACTSGGMSTEVIATNEIKTDETYKEEMELSSGPRTLNLIFDGESCIYKGPTELTPGPVELFFYNNSGGMAAVNFLMHLEGKTVQDVIDYIGEEPTLKHAPAWTQELGTYEMINSGDMHDWEGNLEPGIYHMVCVRIVPFGVWFGTGLTVE